MSDLFLPNVEPTVFSSCRKYRYELWRRWGTGPFLMVIGLNPSTADETANDPTIRRCIDFAKRWGFDALCMTNLFAFRATMPEVMMSEREPVGLDNDTTLEGVARDSGMVLAAWGRHGSHRGRASLVYRWLREINKTVHCLAVNADGSPRHPLYVRADSKPFPWTIENLPLPSAKESK